MIKFFKQLIQSNSGVSSKSFFLVTVTIVGIILLIVPAIILIIEVCVNKTIQTDLNGLAAYIGAVGVLFTSVGVTKAWSEKFENHSNSKEEESYE